VESREHVAAASGQVPLVDYLVLGSSPHLEASQCEACGARFFDRRNACAACTGTTFARVPVNVSGGLESKGHPIAATGIANIWELCQHLRGEAGPRQIDGAKVGLAHVIGLGQACGLHILGKATA